MPEELNLPEATPPTQRGEPDPLSIEPDPLSIEPEKPADEPEVVTLEPEPEPEPVVLAAEPVVIDNDEPISLVDEAESDAESHGISMVHQRSGLRKAQEVTLNRPMNCSSDDSTGIGSPCLSKLAQ